MPGASGAPGAPTPLQRKGMRNVILAQIFGCLIECSLTNGVLLLYLTESSASNVVIMVYLSLHLVSRAVVLIPAAYLADRYGIKRIGYFGLVGAVFSGLILSTAGFLREPVALIVFGLGLAFYGLSMGVVYGGWYALLSAVAPNTVRGKFLGNLRFAWQFFGILFGIVCTFFLTKDSPLIVYQAIFFVTTLGMALRIIFYKKIPQMAEPRNERNEFFGALGHVIRAKGYASFCCYAFLLTLYTAYGPSLFGLIEKKRLLLGDGSIVWLGNLLAGGAILGFLVGGRMVDRWGTKPAFLFCHFSYALVMLLFLGRGMVPLPLMVYLGGLHIAFGFTMSASSIAVSTEMLAIAPEINKALATSVCNALQIGGGAISGLLCAGAIRLGLFNDSWSLLGEKLSSFDALLLIFSILVLLLVVTLGLVPSVIRKAEWAP